MVFELKITVLWFKGSAPPLATEVGSLIKKVTLALRSHIRGNTASRSERTVNSGPVNAYRLTNGRRILIWIYHPK